MVRSIEGRADLLNRCQKNLGCDHTFSISHHAQAVNLTEQTHHARMAKGAPSLIPPGKSL
jgi:hypothetical protein